MRRIYRWKLFEIVDKNLQNEVIPPQKKTPTKKLQPYHLPCLALLAIFHNVNHTQSLFNRALKVHR